MIAGARHSPPTGAVPWPGWTRWLLRFGLPFAMLNAMFTLENIWPTLWARPGLRLSFELCMATLGLTAWMAARGTASARMLRTLAGLTTFWVVTRYVEVTASAVFGREINLYWDGRHLFDVLRIRRPLRLARRRVDAERKRVVVTNDRHLQVPAPRRCVDWMSTTPCISAQSPTMTSSV